MSYFLTTPSGSFSVDQLGVSDCQCPSGIFRFLNCDVLSMNSNIGFNGSPSSLSVTLVEDINDSFLVNTPSVIGFSLPSGGVSAPIIYPTGTTLNSTNPYYFGGIVNSYQRNIKENSAKTISVNISDGREYAAGIQILTGGFSLGQTLSGPRFSGVDNVIDAFGAYAGGLESERNKYGMQFSKIRTIIEASSILIHNILMQYYFTGECFDTPDFYRIEDNIIDLLALAQRVSQDGGSDVIFLPRKISEFSCITEIRGIRRYNTDPLTKTDISNFISSRSDIIESARVGQEVRTEAENVILFGGAKNSNYTAYPSEYKQDIHLQNFTTSSGTTASGENYNSFPANIITRLFGGDWTKSTEQTNGSGINVSQETLDVDSGAIFPFWGFTPDDHAYPLIEPFLSLDHFVFDKQTQALTNIYQRIPCCKISVQNYSVREVPHQEMFLDGDGASDNRPFAYVNDIIFSNTVPTGYMRGLPLNTEVMRAAIAGPQTFFNLYNIYYPDIAQKLGLPTPNFKNILDLVNSSIGNGNKPSVEDFQFTIMDQTFNINSSGVLPNPDGNGRIAKNILLSPDVANVAASQVLEKFSTSIHEWVKQYALDNMGKKFLVCLPQSNIMQRIWTNQEVPTNPNQPDIEYVVDERGYFTYIPPELDGIITGSSGTSVFTVDEEEQINRKFEGEDGRYYAMVGIDWKPKGNCSFNSNGINRAMFQDFPTSEFRPNRIASGNPTYVLVSAQVQQLRKRPDLALVSLPNAIMFDPADPTDLMHSFQYNNKWNEKMAKKAGIIKYLWYHYKRNQDFRAAIKLASTANGKNMDSYASQVISIWADKYQTLMSDPSRAEMSTEFVMDLKGVMIPLTSTWVSYGPWYYDSSQAAGIRKIDVDESLVPWNFARSNPWYQNLYDAGQERVARSLSIVDYLDNASITAAGYPEYGLFTPLGFNSNITSINIDFGIQGVKTTYNFATYLAKPGTYRKSEYDNVSRARIDTREKVPDIVNENLYYYTEGAPSFGPNQFRF